MHLPPLAVFSCLVATHPACPAGEPRPAIRPAALAAEGDEDVARLLGEADALRAAIDGARRTAGSVRLLVNGEEVPAAAVERALAFMFGRAYIERKTRDFLVADEIEYRRKSGQTVEDLHVGTAEILKEVESMKEQLQAQIMGGFKLDAVLRLQGMDEASLADEQASLLLFDKVFIPDDPDKWPESTRQALVSQGGEGGQDFVEKTTKGLKEHREKNPNEPIPPFYRQIFRQWIVKALKEASRIRTASDGLPFDTVLTVNDRRLPTAEAYPAVARLVTAFDREKALRWTAWATAVRQALVQAGVYLSDEAFAKDFEAHEAPYKKSPLNIEVVATAFKKFPSYDLYREYFRLRRSFEKMIEKEVTEEALARHRDRVQDFLGDGKVDAQVILCTALDYTDFSWKGPDAFDAAKKRAEEAMGQLRAGKPFDELIDRYSEFFDPPAAPGGQNQPQQPRPNRGRFGLQSKNQVKQLLGESEFDELVRGYSIAEILFHDVPVGEAVGPIKGPLGYYIGRVVSRYPGRRAVDLAQENSRNLVQEDYLARRFLDWSNDVVAKAKIEVR